jgi:hypothetical protein
MSFVHQSLPQLPALYSLSSNALPISATETVYKRHRLSLLLYSPQWKNVSPAGCNIVQIDFKFASTQSFKP